MINEYDDDDKSSWATNFIKLNRDISISRSAPHLLVMLAGTVSDSYS